MTIPKENKGEKEQTILGIKVIEAIVSKATRAITSSSEILSAMKQVLFFYKLIPDEWKKKAFWVFEKLWSRKEVVISTSPDQTRQIYDVEFEDKKLKKLVKENFILQHPTSYGPQYALNPQRLQDVMTIISNNK